jgi:hypothetical protein
VIPGNFSEPTGVITEIGRRSSWPKRMKNALFGKRMVLVSVMGGRGMDPSGNLQYLQKIDRISQMRIPPVKSPVPLRI